jgi:hypothetical protein
MKSQILFKTQTKKLKSSSELISNLVILRGSRKILLHNNRKIWKLIQTIFHFFFAARSYAAKAATSAAAAAQGKVNIVEIKSHCHHSLTHIFTFSELS